MASGLTPEQERRVLESILRLRTQLLEHAAIAHCAGLDLIELHAQLDETPRPEQEIAEAAIARARMRGIE